MNKNLHFFERFAADCLIITTLVIYTSCALWILFHSQRELESSTCTALMSKNSLKVNL